MLNQIKAKSYERSLIEEKVNNFDVTMPEYLADEEKITVLSVSPVIKK